MKKILLLISFFCFFHNFGQDLSLYDQFNGRYDYTAIGNTLNPSENGAFANCVINTQSDANLTLSASQTVEAAYLYWAGTGTGDFQVNLNNQPLSADRTFNFTLDSTRDFFAAFKDITNIVTTTGNGNYTLSDLDLTNVINTSNYCQTGTTFGGWAIIIIYEDTSLPLNQVNVYDGLQSVSILNTSITINLNNLNVIDNQGAKIGFLAWEGDQGISNNESLRINGNILSNPPLNPADNAFNGTNSFTNSNDLYNMDLDVYDIENNINIGDTSAQILLTSGDGISSSDLVMVNNVVTVLNTELPEPSPEIDDVLVECQSREIEVDYTIYNTNATDFLPANTLISFFANNQLLGQTNTQNDIPIDGSESGQITLQIPANIPDNFNLNMSVNIDGNGDPIITEIDPSNNFDDLQVQLLDIYIENPPEDLEQCDDLTNDGVAFFDLTINQHLAIGNQTNVEVSFHHSQTDAENNIDPIDDPSNYENQNVPEGIYLRLTSTIDSDCYIIESFILDIFFTPVAEQPEDLEVCNENPEGKNATFNLTENNPIIIDNQPNSSVRFYTSEIDAENNKNSIVNPTDFQNTTSPQRIYVRLFNANHPECFTTTSFLIDVKDVNVSSIDGFLNCDEGFDQAFSDLTEIEQQLNLSASEEIIGFYTSLEYAFTNTNAITNSSNYKNQQNPQKIYIRVDDLSSDDCYRVISFNLSIENCPPFIPEAFSPNNDGVNDTFEISGLYDIFENFNLKIYSRYGNLIYEANNTIPAWDGTSNRGVWNQGKELPTGTYYYILNLNDPNFKVYKSWVYLHR
ncbi:gliding motility-associated C-terminal domain-containing protein [Mesonia aquimarina]|uniref:gliding motility-associated C-terminal domain-containing protein n=1 Tax=Mesonia aquimarina TaxID=1504967 RepID=UPI000EF5801A|nr:gliding motility-associated C-terminal domain-containing protein [Mesonia aquimarina]